MKRYPVLCLWFLASAIVPVSSSLAADTSSRVAEQAGMCPVPPIDADMTADVYDWATYNSLHADLRCISDADETCEPANQALADCKCTAPCTYENTLRVPRFGGLPVPEACLAELGLQVRKQCGDHLYCQTLLGKKEEAAYRWTSLPPPRTGDKAALCRAQAKPRGSVTTSYSQRFHPKIDWTAAPACAFDGSITPTQIRCDSLVPYECRKKEVTYKKEPLCAMLPPIVAGRYQLSVNGNVNDFDARTVVCNIVYQAPKIVLTGNSTAVTADETCGTINLGSAVTGTTAVGAMTNAYCERLNARLSTLDFRLSRPLFLKAWMSEYRNYARVDPTYRYTETAWRRWVEDVRTTCEKVDNGAGLVTRDPSDEDNATATKWYEKLAQDLLKDPANNPPSTWACCAKNVPAPAPVPAPVPAPAQDAATPVSSRK